MPSSPEEKAKAFDEIRDLRGIALILVSRKTS